MLALPLHNKSSGDGSDEVLVAMSNIGGGTSDMLQTNLEVIKIEAKWVHYVTRT